MLGPGEIEGIGFLLGVPEPLPDPLKIGVLEPFL
jgi:hypothetical protein